MHSDDFPFTLRQLAGLLLPTAACLLGLVVLLHVADILRLLPAPPITVEGGNQTLNHQFRACHSQSSAQIVLLGDSTCLVGVDAPSLSRQLPGRPGVLSLALFIQYDLTVYAEEVADFAAANPNQLRSVVLLATPPKLGGMGMSQFNNLWEQLYDPPPDGWQRLAAVKTDWSGARLLRRHLLSHLLATPLRLSGAAFYGFSSETEAYQTLHCGSVACPGELTIPRQKDGPRLDFNHPLPLRAEIEAHSRAFRAKMPPGIKLFIGLTPVAVPMAVAPPAARRQQADLLQRWNASIQADVLLTNLPPTLPYGYFTPGNHLNLMGQKFFTAKLAQELARCSEQIGQIQPPSAESH
jgi:hypothetical protein